MTLSAPVDGGAGWSVDASDALADGTYTAQVEQSDAAGNLGRSTAHPFTVAATSPP